jgi:GTP cyclohydrolase II
MSVTVRALTVMFVTRRDAYGLEIVEQLPLEMPASQHNRRHPEARKYRLGHNLRNV